MERRSGDRVTTFTRIGRRGDSSPFGDASSPGTGITTMITTIGTGTGITGPAPVVFRR